LAVDTNCYHELALLDNLLQAGSLFPPSLANFNWIKGNI